MMIQYLSSFPRSFVKVSGLSKILFFFALTWLVGAEVTSQVYDVVVYGASASGTVAAIAAAGEGASVLMIEPGKNVGGMVTGGLSHNDYHDRSVIGGLALEFYKKVADYYDKPLYYWRGPEPHVGEMIFRDWLRESGVNLMFENRVIEVIKEKEKIKRIILSDGTQVEGKVFIDASYEGDLMARAGVSYSVGREGVDEYDESWAGRRAILQDGHQMLPGVSPFDENGNLLPLINTIPLVGEGEADKAVQGYGFRLIVTTDKENRIPFPKPENYDPKLFELVKRYYEVHPDADNMVHLWPTLPNGKTDMNSSGPISTNFKNELVWEYPDADYDRRDQIWQTIKDYTLGLLYFLSNDPSVPERIRKQTSEMGLCKDEFVENDHWPHQLYIRVARRMNGEYFMTQHDLECDTVKYDAIGMGSYNIDVRHVQRTYIPVSRFPELHYEVYNEGYISIPVAPYEIPYRSLVPKYHECTNLIVPVCMSASFIANASIRMEPQYMIMGHAAGIAAALSILDGRAVQKVDIADLQKKLAEQGQILSLQDYIYGAYRFKDEIVIDNNMMRFTAKTGAWSEIEMEPENRYQMNFARNSDENGAYIFKPWLYESGQYDIFIWFPSSSKYSKKATVKIIHSTGEDIRIIDQTRTGGQWIRLGKFNLEEGNKSSVIIDATASEGTVVADAVMFKRLN